MKPITFLFCLLLTACGGGSDPTASIDQTRAPWQVLDLETGVVTARAELPDLATDPRYRDQWMAFRLVLAPESALGQAPGTFARQDDEASSVAQATCYIGAFEVTRAQWRRLSGSTPWTAPAVAAVDGAGGSDAVPATGFGLTSVVTALTVWNRGHQAHLAVPSPVQWEIAVRGGENATYPWGEDHRTSTVSRCAVTWETGVLHATSGPQPVGTRQANGLGIYDGVGNVWELTNDGWARGGSWADGVALARPANRRAVPEDGWATVGVRFVYQP